MNLHESWREMGALVLCRHEFKRTGLTASALFAPPDAVTAARRLYEAGYFLEDLTLTQVKEGFLAAWYFDSLERPGRVALMALAPRGTFVSFCSVYPGAEWHEREAADFFGATFIANTNPVPLLLADDFDEAPPLLKPEKELAALRDLGLFGECEIIDPAWAAFVLSEQKEEGAA